MILLFFVFPPLLEGNMMGALMSLALLVCLYASVVAHEFAHIFMGRRFGIQTRTIIINFFGGAAMMDRIPFGLPEVAIGIAGPTFSAVLGALIFIPFVLGASHGNMVSNLIYNIGYINVILAFFNLLPIFPMDGGRILRGVLFHFNRKIVLSTKIVVIVGFTILPVAMLTLVGINLWTMIIMGLILWMGLQEWKQVRLIYRDDMQNPNLLHPNQVREYIMAVSIFGPDAPESKALRARYSNVEFDRVADTFDDTWRQLSPEQQKEIQTYTQTHLEDK
jgi:Zn-dependent protease